MALWKLRLIQGIDRALGVAVIGLTLGTALSFGGVVWWSRPLVASLALGAAVAWLVRVALLGRWVILQSPAVPIFGLAISLGLVQLVPLPTAVAGRISRRALATNALGVIPDQVVADDPSFTIPATFETRSPLSLDRPATLRWVVAALACLAVFWVVTHFGDHLRHVRLVWGCVVAAFFVNVVLGVVQLAGGVAGVYGFITPGAGPVWGPSLDDLMAAPVPSVLRVVGTPRADQPILAAARALPLSQFGTLVGGPGAFLALASLAIPLALGLTLQTLSPRGGRAGLLARLRDSGQGSQVVLTLALTAVGAVLVGSMGGKWASLPFAVGIMTVGLFGTWSTGIRQTGWLATFALLLAMGGGVAIHELTTPRDYAPGELAPVAADLARVLGDPPRLPDRRDRPGHLRHRPPLLQGGRRRAELGDEQPLAVGGRGGSRRPGSRGDPRSLGVDPSARRDRSRRDRRPRFAIRPGRVACRLWPLLRDSLDGGAARRRLGGRRRRGDRQPLVERWDRPVRGTCLIDHSRSCPARSTLI